LNKDINLNLYKVFYHVATTKSFKKASEILCVSQPAISKQIKNLEDLLDVKLFYRFNKGIELTKEGNILLEQVEKAIFYLEASEKYINFSKNLNSGKLVIGCQSHIAYFYLLDIVEKFINDYNGIKIDIISDSTSELLDGLKHHRIDFVIDNYSEDEAPFGFNLEKITVFDTIFISSNNSKYKIKSIKDLDNVNLVLPLERSSMRRNIERQLRDNGVNLNIVLSVDTTKLIVSAVEKDIGIGYVIKDCVKEELNNKTIKEVKIDCDFPKFGISLVYNKDYLSFPAIKFINEYIKK
jgi:DNA-binding transcriptional LysR family regulator